MDLLVGWRSVNCNCVAFAYNAYYIHINKWFRCLFFHLRWKKKWYENLCRCGSALLQKNEIEEKKKPMAKLHHVISHRHKKKFTRLANAIYLFFSISSETNGFSLCAERLCVLDAPLLFEAFNNHFFVICACSRWGCIAEISIWETCIFCVCVSFGPQIKIRRKLWQCHKIFIFDANICAHTIQLTFFPSAFHRIHAGRTDTHTHTS